jgi:hypothetical protein
VRDEYEFGSIREYAVLGFVRIFPDKYFEDGEREKGDKSHIPTGFVFVIDPKFGAAAQHKMPGGHGQGSDASPLAAMGRELLGETGLNSKVIHYVGKWPGRGSTHWKVLFTCDIAESDVPWMNSNERENEGEQPKRFSIHEFQALVRDYMFMHEHYEKLVAFGLIFPVAGELQAKGA